MAAGVAQRFNFRFAELAPAPRLEIVRPETGPLPAFALAVAPGRRPRWMPRLLPVFRPWQPMLVEVAGGAAPVFAARATQTLAAVIATAGAEAGVECAAWGGGLAAGAGRLDRLPAKAQVTVVAVELEPASIAAARLLLEREREGAAVLAIAGRSPALERALGVPGLEERALATVRLPLTTDADLRLAARGIAPGAGRRGPGRHWVGLAAAIVRAYLQVCG